LLALSSPSANQGFAHEVFTADADVGVLLDVVDKLTMHRRHPIVAEIRHGGHGHAEPLHLLGLEVAEDLGRVLSLRLSINTAAISMPPI
jgi:hypothetical protein